MIKKVLIINGVERTLVLEGTETLAKVLRERLMLTGCKSAAARATAARATS